MITSNSLKQRPSITQVIFLLFRPLLLAFQLWIRERSVSLVCIVEAGQKCGCALRDGVYQWFVRVSLLYMMSL